jgi:hypothetical protein
VQKGVRVKEISTTVYVGHHAFLSEDHALRAQWKSAFPRSNLKRKEHPPPTRAHFSVLAECESADAGDEKQGYHSTGIFVRSLPYVNAATSFINDGMHAQANASKPSLRACVIFHDCSLTCHSP